MIEILKDFRNPSIKMIKMSPPFHKHPELWLLTACAFLTRFLWLGYPREAVFDEVHFGKFLTSYFTGTAFFDIHPPLGKLLYAAVGWLAGFAPGFAFDHIGEPYPATVPIFALRLLPALLGALLVPLLYLIARALGNSRPAATLVAGFALLDNALLVQSRFMLLDIPLLFFGFSAILFFLRGEKKIEAMAGHNFFLRNAGGAATHDRSAGGREPSSAGERPLRSADHVSAPEPLREKIGWAWFHSPWPYFFLSALALSLAISIKWTALAFFVPLGFLFVRLVFRTRLKPRFDLKVFTLFLGLAAALYAGFFALHFSLTEPAKLEGFLENFLTLQGQMHSANLQDLRHPNESRWFEWPWAKRSVFYWQSNPGGVAVAWIYLLGNPFVWWVGLGGVGVGVGVLMKQGVGKLFKKLLSHKSLAAGEGAQTTEESEPAMRRGRQTGLLLGLYLSYLANLLPFIRIERAMFLYHYFPALIFSFFILGVLLDRLVKKEAARWLALGLILASATITFLHFAPLSYGLRLDAEAFSTRLWLPSWR